MTRALLTHSIVYALTCAFLAGCGKSENPAPRYNEALGAYGPTPGALNVDPGISQDGASYKPATPPGQPAGSSDTTASSGGAGGGPEIDAIRTVAKDALTAISKLDVTTALDAFIPDQVAELKKDPTSSSLRDTQSEFEKFIRVLRDKAPVAAGDPAAQAKLLDGLVAGAKIEVVGPDTARLSFDATPDGAAPAGATPTDPTAALAQLKPMLAGLPGGGVQFKKIDKNWLVSLPKPITEKQGQLVAAASDFAREFMLKAEERLDAVTDKLDQTALQNLALAVMGDLSAQLQALKEKFRGVMEEAGSAAPSETKPGDAEQPKTDTPPQGPRTPNRGRRVP